MIGDVVQARCSFLPWVPFVALCRMVVNAALRCVDLRLIGQRRCAFMRHIADRFAPLTT
jgi:hypothetical protein